MYSAEDRRFAVDLWFEMLGSISMDDFVAELGWPSRTALSGWVRADPRHDPDKAQYRSSTVLSKLELIRRVADGSSVSRAERESGVSRGSGGRAVKLYAEGGTAALLPKATTRARARMCEEKKARARGRAPYLDQPEVPADLPDDPAALKAIIGELQMSNAVLREVLDVLKADPGCDPASLTNREKAAVAFNLGDRYAATELCALLGLPRSSRYYALGAMTRPGARDLIARDVREIFEVELESARGYRCVKLLLDGRLGRPVSEKVVRDSMREQGLAVAYSRRGRRRYSSYAGEIDGAAPNLLLRPDGTHDFRAALPNRVWASDITEFRLPGARKVYLSPVLDLFDGKPVAWSISTSPDAELADSSLAKACASLAPGEHPVAHTDRGCHYRWPGWKRICAENGVVRSMSRKGRSPDNAAMEGFFGTLKNEFFYGRDWRGYGAREFAELLDAWMRRYSAVRLKAFRDGGRTVYDTIDNRRKRLGLAS